jgi:hypothetical protein
MTGWTRVATVSGPLLAATRRPGSPAFASPRRTARGRPPVPPVRGPPRRLGPFLLIPASPYSLYSAATTGVPRRRHRPRTVTSPPISPSTPGSVPRDQARFQHDSDRAYCCAARCCARTAGSGVRSGLGSRSVVTAPLGTKALRLPGRCGFRRPCAASRPSMGSSSRRRRWTHGGRPGSCRRRSSLRCNAPGLRST